ncbi:MAG TPA: ergothioneine biosynthesis protein EgtB [Balneolales bacterium]|nr:ergothioneine biosynthesis protein EgtB [Balneolales bacterium]
MGSIIQKQVSNNSANEDLREASFQNLRGRYMEVRKQTEYLCEPLEIEDYLIQTMANVSPTKWHLAHTSWFFETFILSNFIKDYKSYHPKFAYLFNSYYVQAGERHCRPKRGLISRPTVREVYEYRHYIDEQMSTLLEYPPINDLTRLYEVTEIGLNHEQQHQELMITDIKHVFSMNPLYPAYRHREVKLSSVIPVLHWVDFDGGLMKTGHDKDGFCFDNELPRHNTYIHSFQLANRLITNAEYLEFMKDGGYERPEIWLSDGWNIVESQNWNSPYYWEKRDDEWWMITLQGPRKINPAEPVCHISHYEADAFARWSNARLATEAEWEIASQHVPVEGNLVESENYHPVPLADQGDSKTLCQMHGDVWEWTQSAYLPYPGYHPLPGALGEYNGKFMANQIVLKGGSCATPKSHIRKSYRNFFHPDTRWQFTGIRLARDI